MGKKAARSMQHLSSCADADCAGCDVGDIDIQLVAGGSGELSAADKHRAAQEELAKKQLAEQDVDAATHQSIVARLFEMATSSFEDEIRAAAKTSDPAVDADKLLQKLPSADVQSALHASKRRKVTQKDADEVALLPSEIVDKMQQYAACLLDFGRFMDLHVHLRRAFAVLNQFCLPSWKSTKEQTNAAGWALLGRSATAVALSNLEKNQQPAEPDLVEIAIDAFNKASNASASHQNKSIETKMSRLAGIELARLAAAMHKDAAAACRILSAALAHFDAVSKSDGNQHDVLHDTDAATAHASCLYHLANINQHLSATKSNPSPLECVRKAVLMLKPIMDRSDQPQLPASAFQLLGESAMLQSSLEDDDEDAVLEAFDLAENALQHALELDPDNEEIQKQLQDIGALETTDEED